MSSCQRFASFILQHPILIVFQLKGSIWLEVLPYCILNCAITVLVTLAKQNGISIAFSPEGHAALGLLVSFLVINKVYLALDRYMQIRSYMGVAFLNLRELNQLAFVYTEGQQDEQASAWRNKVRRLVVEICDCTIRVLNDEDKAAYLSRNECVEKAGDDPISYARTLRSHLYNGSSTLSTQLEMMEKMTCFSTLASFTSAYRELLKIASTPLPFPMIQMGRTFLFLWIFSMPLALGGLELQLSAVLVFICFITYGYIGLELVAIRLLRPWGDDINDLNIDGVRDATLSGIDNDCKGEEQPSHNARTKQNVSVSDSYFNIGDTDHAEHLDA